MQETTDERYRPLWPLVLFVHCK